MYIIYALLASVFSGLTSVFAKTGIKNIDSLLATFLRTIVVLIILTTITLFKKKYKSIKDIEKRSWLFIILSGLSTSLSWLFYFKALALGEASVVFPIEKLSLVVSILISITFLKEKVNKKQIIGIIIIFIGTSLLFF